MDINFLEVDSAKIVEDILNQLETRIEEPLYPGDERRIFGEALAMVINAQVQTINDSCRQRLLRYARGEVLDALGENRGIKRIQPTPAETVLQFSVDEALSQNVIIPQGIRVTGIDNLFFETERTVVLQAGSKTVNVTACSIEGGSQYNGIGIGKLDTIVDKSEIIRINAVTNLTETSGGGNIEDDTTLRERIRTAENVVSCGTIPGYKAWTLSANSKIVDAAISTGKEHITVTKPVTDGKVYLCAPSLVAGSIQCSKTFTYVKDDDGLITMTLSGESLPTTIDVSFERVRYGVVTVRPILAGGEIPDADVLADVKEVLERDDVKPLTDMVEVLAPEAVSYDIEVEYWTTTLDEAVCVQTMEKSDGAIADYVYWQDSAISQDINPDQLTKRMLCPHAGTGATRVKIIKPVFTELESDQVAKWSGKLKISHHVKG